MSLSWTSEDPLGIKLGAFLVKIGRCEYIMKPVTCLFRMPEVLVQVKREYVQPCIVFRFSNYINLITRLQLLSRKVKCL